MNFKLILSMFLCCALFACDDDGGTNNTNNVNNTNNTNNLNNTDRLEVVATVPANGALDVDVTAPVEITFLAPVTNPTGGSVEISPTVPGLTLDWTSTWHLEVTFGQDLEAGQVYTITVRGFTAAGMAAMADHVWSFTTAQDDTCEFGPDEPYSINPTLGRRVPNGSINIDGHNDGEWTDELVIALDLANDDPRSLGDNWTFHETPWDLTHLWAAWDDDYLYLAWQYVDVTDVIDPANAGSSHGSYPAVMDLIQWIALDTIPGQGATMDMWGKNGGVPYWSGTDLPDYQIYVASNLWQGYISRAVDGVFPVDDGGVNYHSLAEVGIVAAVGTELAATTLWGVSDVDLRLSPEARVEFVGAGHDGTRDSFYELKIPLSALGNPDLETLGIGVMLGQGEHSCLDTIPHDEATLDTQGVSPSNSPLEWLDEDTFTTPFARIGHCR
jgi:hypothetical protein